ncbi:unnamed protein product [Ceutorhynchus assimilis]|uniref:DUF4746 domain-containing protein n=1 Tax=Ceutorhynchus assimilis TaxID=467358 RepID=A0A9N9MRQ5_9CUCU|nr:unnamed protein product [Ceutorhynchus assimilis]
MGNNRLTFALVFKRSNENLTGNIDDVVLQLVYGNSRKPPGDDRSPARKLLKVWNRSGRHKDWVDVVGNLSEEELKEAKKDLMFGIWAPPNSLSKAMVLKLLFPNLSNPFKIPDLKEIPLHVAVAYDAFKAKDIFELGEKYPGKIMSYGYFSSDLPGEAKLLGKTTEKFETRNATVTYEEKLVIQLAKEDRQCFMDFIDLGPSYMSTDVEVGVLDCQYFFPPGYNTPESEIITYLKKKTKRKGKIGKFRAGTDQLQDGDSQSVITGTEVDSSVADLGEDTVIGDDANNEEAESDEEEADDVDKGEEETQISDVLESADKATSPVAE